MNVGGNEDLKIKQRGKGVVYVIVSALGFSLIPILAQIGLSPDMTSGNLLFYRFAIAAIIFVAYCLIKRKPIKLPSIKQYIYVVLADLYTVCSVYFSFLHSIISVHL